MSKRAHPAHPNGIDDPRTESFLGAIIEVYKAYDLSLSHEDHRGGFIVENLSQANIDWLKRADIDGNVEVIPAPTQPVQKGA